MRKFIGRGDYPVEGAVEGLPGDFEGPAPGAPVGLPEPMTVLKVLDPSALHSDSASQRSFAT